MKKIIKKLKGNQGNAVYIISIVFLIFMIALTYGIIFVSSQYAVITDIKRTAQVTLDSYVDKKSVEIYSSVKNSNDYTKAISSDKFEQDLQDNLGLDQASACYTDGRLKYQFVGIELEHIDKPTLKIRAVIRIYMPYYFLGQEITAIDSNLVLESNFNFK